MNQLIIMYYDMSELIYSFKYYFTLNSNFFLKIKMALKTLIIVNTKSLSIQANKKCTYAVNQKVVI